MLHFNDIADQHNRHIGAKPGSQLQLPVDINHLDLRNRIERFFSSLKDSRLGLFAEAARFSTHDLDFRERQRTIALLLRWIDYGKDLIAMAIDQHPQRNTLFEYPGMFLEAFDTLHPMPVYLDDNITTLNT